MIMNFHEIAFNENKNKALVIRSVSPGRLDRFYKMIFIKKTGNKWTIEDTIGLSIS